MRGLGKHAAAVGLQGWRANLTDAQPAKICGFKIKQQNIDMLRLGGISLRAWNNYQQNMTRRALERCVAQWALRWSTAEAERQLALNRKRSKAAAAEALRQKRRVEQAAKRRRTLQKLTNELGEMYHLDRAVLATIHNRLVAGFEWFVCAVNDAREWQKLGSQACLAVSQLQQKAVFVKLRWMLESSRQQATTLEKTASLVQKLNYGQTILAFGHWVESIERAIRGARLSKTTYERMKEWRRFAYLAHWREWLDRVDGFAKLVRRAKKYYSRRSMGKRIKHWRSVVALLAEQAGPMQVIENQRLFNLGLCHQRGEGVVKSAEKAIECWKIAAKNGYQPAQFSLGMIYFKGEGVPRNVTKGMALLEDAGVFSAIQTAHF